LQNNTNTTAPIIAEIRKRIIPPEEL